MAGTISALRDVALTHVTMAKSLGIAESRAIGFNVLADLGPTREVRVAEGVDARVTGRSEAVIGCVVVTSMTL